ncbi:MAG: single-stranded-DNA-specific exonuclease RecJ [Desulfobulbus sp.]|nr:MAG: single-stranded-DNA-specific exonuclease RecJ [Desulfobulbus sp.]
MKKYTGYIIREPGGSADNLTAKQLAGELSVSVVIAELLMARGIYTQQDADSFLFPKLSNLPPALSMKGMSDAVEIMMNAVVEKTPIAVQGDYDVDGITGTSILVDFLRLLGLEVHFHLPDRMTEGYGLSRDSIERFVKKVPAPGVLITVDNGISSIEEVQYAVELGLKVIVTDHHQPGAKLPQADALINPVQKGCAFSETNISGAGVAFFFVMAMRRELVSKGIWEKETMPNLKNYLDLVALGTVADVMDLVHVNRILVKAGLEVISTRKRIGVKALCDCSRISDNTLRSEDISFRIAPRINAAGRLGRPEVALKLLLSKSRDKALVYAEKLEKINQKRREIESSALVEAMKQAEKQIKSGIAGIVVHNSHWHPGVIGIIASRIVDKFGLPTFVLTDDKEESSNIYRGSGRSVENFNLFKALTACKKSLLQFGGHAMAAGVTLQHDRLSQFQREFSEYVLSHSSQQESQALAVDKRLNEKDNFRHIAQGLQLMEPFGKGNHEPVFMLKKIQIHNPQVLREHLTFSLRMNNTTFRGIGFYMAHYFAMVSSPIDLCFKIKQSTFRGTSRVEVHAVEMFTSS